MLGDSRRIPIICWMSRYIGFFVCCYCYRKKAEIVASKYRLETKKRNLLN